MSTGRNTRLEFLGQLAGGLAHEIKNPLSTMKLTLQLLEEDMADSNSPLANRSRRKIELLLKEVDHLNEVVHEFLNLARGHDLKFSRLDLPAMLNDIQALFNDQAEKCGIRINVILDGELSDFIVDGKWIRQAVTNLVVNAMDAIDDTNGEIVIRASGRRDIVSIEVMDNGCGIEPSNRDRMFRPYFTTKQGGTGMGLPMVRRIVEEHGGQVTMDSEVGKGSRFVMLLPRSPDKRGALQAMVAVPPRGNA